MRDAGRLEPVAMVRAGGQARQLVGLGGRADERVEGLGEPLGSHARSAVKGPLPAVSHGLRRIKRNRTEPNRSEAASAAALSTGIGHFLPNPSPNNDSDSDRDRDA